MTQLKQLDAKPPQSLDQLIAEQDRAKEVNGIASEMIVTLAAEMTRGEPTRKALAQASHLMATIAMATFQATAGFDAAATLLEDLKEFAGRRQ